VADLLSKIFSFRKLQSVVFEEQIISPK